MFLIVCRSDQKPHIMWYLIWEWCAPEEPLCVKDESMKRNAWVLCRTNCWWLMFQDKLKAPLAHGSYIANLVASGTKSEEEYWGMIHLVIWSGPYTQTRLRLKAWRRKGSLIKTLVFFLLPTLHFTGAMYGMEPLAPCTIWPLGVTERSSSPLPSVSIFYILL